MAASIRTLLPAMVRHRRSKKVHTGGLICGEEGVGKGVYDLDIPSRRPKIYFEMVNLS